MAKAFAAQALLAAAQVIELTPHIRAYLEATDPKALEQLRGAIAAEANALADPIEALRQIEALTHESTARADFEVRTEVHAIAAALLEVRQ